MTAVAQPHPARQALRTFAIDPRWWWVRVLAIFAASRAISTGWLLWFADRQLANSWTGPSPSYADFAKMWDGHWYYIIAVSGYPTELPMTDDGHVAENQWAFMPLYPFLARALMAITGLDFAVVAVVVSVGFAAGTALLFYKLMHRLLPPGGALFAVVLYCVQPLSPLLQVAYAESMFAFFLTLALYLLVTRRYVLLLPAIVLMGFTRPGGLAFALALGIHAIHRFVIRGREPFPIRERVEVVVAGLVGILTGFGWLLIAGAVTGDLFAYTETELAWRSAYIGYTELLPFGGFIAGLDWWFGTPWGYIVGGLAVGLFVVFLMTPWARRLGIDVIAWSASYVLYIAAVFFPQSSTFRILFPAFPLLGALAVPTSRWFRVPLVLLFVVLQPVWLHFCWWVDGYDWTPP